MKLLVAPFLLLGVAASARATTSTADSYKAAFKAAAKDTGFRAKVTPKGSDMYRGDLTKLGEHLAIVNSRFKRWGFYVPFLNERKDRLEELNQNLEGLVRIDTKHRHNQALVTAEFDKVVSLYKEAEATVNKLKEAQDRAVAEMNRNFENGRKGWLEKVAKMQPSELRSEIISRIDYLLQRGRPQVHKEIAGTSESESEQSTSFLTRRQGRSRSRAVTYENFLTPIDITFEFELPEYVVIQGMKRVTFDPIGARELVEKAIELTDLVKAAHAQTSELGLAGEARDWLATSTLRFRQWGTDGKQAFIQFDHSLPRLLDLDEIGIPTAGLVEALE